eukprot:UC1_evm3s1810
MSSVTEDMELSAVLECLSNPARLGERLPFVAATFGSRRLLAQPPTAPDGQPARSVQRWVKRINSLLHAGPPQVRASALRLLELTVRHCSPRLLVAHGGSWFGTAARLLRVSPHVTVAACSALAELFRQTNAHPVLRRDAASTHIPAVWKQLIALLKEATATAKSEAAEALLAASDNGMSRPESLPEVDLQRQDPARPAPPQSSSHLPVQIELVPVLACCSALCRAFPGAGRPYISALRTACGYLFAHGDAEVRNAAAATYAASARVVATKTAANAWRVQVLELIAAQHQILHEIMAMANGSGSGSGSGSGGAGGGFDEGRVWRIELLAKKEIPTHLVPPPSTRVTLYSTDALQHRLRLLSSLAIASREMLAQSLAVAVDIPIDNVLTLVLRALALDARQLVDMSSSSSGGGGGGVNSGDAVAARKSRTSKSTLLLQAALASSVGEIQAPLLLLLTSLISISRSAMARYASTVTSALLQVLQSAEPIAARAFYVDEPAGEALRVRCYAAATALATAVGAGMPPVSARTLIRLCLRELECARTVVEDASSTTLVSSGRQRANLDKIGGKGGSAASSAPLGFDKASRRVGSVVSVACLEALTALLHASGPELDAQTRTETDQQLLRCCSAVRTHSNNAPFDAPDVRVRLYDALLASLLTPSSAPQPAGQAARIFASGLNDPSLQVVASCRRALAATDLMMHPRAATAPRSSTQPIMAQLGPGEGEIANPTTTAAETAAEVLGGDGDSGYGGGGVTMTTTTNATTATDGGDGSVGQRDGPIMDQNAEVGCEDTPESPSSSEPMRATESSNRRSPSLRFDPTTTTTAAAAATLTATTSTTTDIITTATAAAVVSEKRTTVPAVPSKRSRHDDSRDAAGGNVHHGTSGLAHYTSTSGDQTGLDGSARESDLIRGKGGDVEDGPRKIARLTKPVSPDATSVAASPAPVPPECEEAVDDLMSLFDAEAGPDSGDET